MRLRIELLSETTFGRGEGTAGLVDTEVDFDPMTGLPFVHARTLKGLFVEECANILYALSRKKPNLVTEMNNSAQFLFGAPGSTLDTDAYMKIGNGKFSEPFSQAVYESIGSSQLSVEDVLGAWTDIRTQTAASVLGVPDEGSLRSIRVVRRGTAFYSLLTFDKKPELSELALLDVVIRTTRRAGLGRNRGRGRLNIALQDDANEDVDYTEVFQKWTETGAKPQ